MLLVVARSFRPIGRLCLALAHCLKGAFLIVLLGRSPYACRAVFWALNFITRNLWRDRSEDLLIDGLNSSLFGETARDELNVEANRTMVSRSSESRVFSILLRLMRVHLSLSIYGMTRFAAPGVVSKT